MKASKAVKNSDLRPRCLTPGRIFKFVDIALKLKGSEMRPFPTRRLYGKYNFVGSNGGSITLQKDGPCPKECRPKEHKKWLLC